MRSFQLFEKQDWNFSNCLDLIFLSFFIFASKLCHWIFFLIAFHVFKKLVVNNRIDTILCLDVKHEKFVKLSKALRFWWYTHEQKLIYLFSDYINVWILISKRRIWANLFDTIKLSKQVKQIKLNRVHTILSNHHNK